MLVQAPVSMIDVAPEALQQRLEPRALPRAHRHLLDDEIAGLGLEPLDRRRAPCRRAPPPCASARPFEQRRVQCDPPRARLDDEPDMDHRHAARARGLSDAGAMFSTTFCALRVRGRARCGEGAALARRRRSACPGSGARSASGREQAPARTRPRRWRSRSCRVRGAARPWSRPGRPTVLAVRKRVWKSGPPQARLATGSGHAHLADDLARGRIDP